MLGRGVKRKWSCLQEPGAGSIPAAAAAEKEQADAGGGVPADPEDMSHLQQRQLVLGLCLEKLQRYQAGMELSLRRSVLLINTLRQIQEDMQSDVEGAGAPDALLGAGDSRLLRGAIREDMSVTCPGCAEGDGEGLPPPPSPSPLPPPPSSPHEASGPPEQQRPAVTISACGEAVSAMGYLGDLALDDIFEDIDTSMYETSDLSAAWAAGSLWPVSVSLWAEEDVKVRSAAHGPAAGLQSCLMDLNELDHIMEILVKS